jgi:hypothetical protein
MSTFQTQLLNEIAAGHDGPQIPESKRIYFQERFRGRLFDFIMTRFLAEQANGLTKAKLARRIDKSPEVISRWMGGPNNLTADSVSDLLLGIAGEEMEMGASKLTGRKRQNYIHLAEAEESNLQSFAPPLERANSTSSGMPDLPFYRAA